MKVPFSQLFEKNRDGSYSPKQRTILVGEEMLPTQKFFDGKPFHGVDLGRLEEESFEVRYDGATANIRGVYQPMKNTQQSFS